MLKQFPAALKLYDRALDIKPNDPELMAYKASIYQAQGNLQEAARILSGINESFFMSLPSEPRSVSCNLNEITVKPFDCCKPGWLNSILILRSDKAVISCRLLTRSALLAIRLARRLPLNRRAIHLNSATEINQTTPTLRQILSKAYAVMGEKELALKLAQRASMLVPRAKDPVKGPTFEENLAVVQTIVGENSGAISTLTELLQTPYESRCIATGVHTPALLRLDPSGILCAPIPLSKNSARKSSREDTNYTNRHEDTIARMIMNLSV